MTSVLLNGEKFKDMIPSIADFGLATKVGMPSTNQGMVGGQTGLYPIQPDYYRAPEAILGCG